LTTEEKRGFRKITEKGKRKRGRFSKLGRISPAQRMEEGGERGSGLGRKDFNLMVFQRRKKKLEVLLPLNSERRGVIGNRKKKIVTSSLPPSIYKKLNGVVRKSRRLLETRKKNVLTLPRGLRREISIAL